MKLQTFQQDQIDTLHDQKVDTDTTLLDQELVTQLLVTLGTLINKHQDTRLSLKVQVNCNYSPVC